MCGVTPHCVCADSDMNVPLVSSPDSASPQQISDYTPDPAVASADVESESQSPRQQHQSFDAICG